MRRVVKVELWNPEIKNPKRGRTSTSALTLCGMEEDQVLNLT
jgi:hypothetical protein